MTKFRIALCAAAAALMSAGASQAGDLITNGDFESGGFAGWSTSGVIANVTESDYGPCCGFTTTHPTNRVAALGGGFGAGVEILSQTFTTEVGVSYTLNYDWAFMGGAANSLDVSVGGVTHSFCCSGSPDFDTSFMHDAITFTGTGLDTVLFRVLDDSQDSTDTMIDNVSIHVPEPSTWALMLSGFGLAGAALRHRRAIAA